MRIVLTVMLALGLAVPAGAAEKMLNIGVLGPLSGGAAQYGVELQRGAEMKSDEINKAGGLKIGGDAKNINLI
jgi:branched-chain amino acid transport system substrate-binding protein